MSSFEFLRCLNFYFLNAFNWACNSHALTNEGLIASHTMAGNFYWFHFHILRLGCCASN